MPNVRTSFEPADIVNEVMSFGSPTPIDISVSGSNFADNLVFAEKLRRQLAEIPGAPRSAILPVTDLSDGASQRRS